VLQAILVGAIWYRYDTKLGVGAILSKNPKKNFFVASRWGRMVENRGRREEIELLNGI